MSSHFLSQQHDGNTKQYNDLYLYTDLLFFVNNNFEKKWLHSIIQCSDRAVFWTDLLCCLFLSFHAFFLREQYGRIPSLTPLSPGAQVHEHCSRNMINDYWSVYYSTFQEHGMSKNWLRTPAIITPCLFQQSILFCILHNHQLALYKSC